MLEKKLFSDLGTVPLTHQLQRDKKPPPNSPDSSIRNTGKVCGTGVPKADQRSEWSEGSRGDKDTAIHQGRHWDRRD